MSPVGGSGWIPCTWLACSVAEFRENSGDQTVSGHLGPKSHDFGYTCCSQSLAMDTLSRYGSLREPEATVLGLSLSAAAGQIPLKSGQQRQKGEERPGCGDVSSAEAALPPRRARRGGERVRTSELSDALGQLYTFGGSPRQCHTTFYRPERPTTSSPTRAEQGRVT